MLEIQGSWSKKVIEIWSEKAEQINDDVPASSNILTVLELWLTQKVHLQLCKTNNIQFPIFAFAVQERNRKIIILL